ncbi:MAG: hypothetical protein AB7E04_09175 [Desulfobacteraceae bacterium]
MDKIDNLHLIENGLLHIQFELTRDKISFFRIAREAHLILYRSMIEALKGTASLPVTGRPSKLRNHKYKIGDNSWQEIYKVEIDGCEKAWRFSEQETCGEPGKSKELNNKKNSKSDNKFLIGFYDALAMIQVECFMKRFVNSEIVYLENKDMKLIEWLHEQIRSEYEHFIPKIYLASIDDLLFASILCVEISQKLIFRSGNITFHNIAPDNIKELFQDIKIQIERVANC